MRRSSLPRRVVRALARGLLSSRSIGRAALISLVIRVASVAALEPSTTLANYGRQSWTMDNGLPQNTVQALTQTQDGFLWVGTEAGLVRFDGVELKTLDRNSTPAMPSGDIRCLLGTKDGALWIGTNAGLARWQGGTMTRFSDANGLPGNVIRTLVQTNDGSLSVGTDLGVAQLSGGRFVADRNHLADNQVGFFAALPDGESAQGSRSGIEIIRGGIDSQRQNNVVVRLAIRKELPGGKVQAILADREGTLWIGTNAGLVRWMKGKLERFPVTDPLATASILALLEDREGNLWVGTETNGLDILRDQRFHTLNTREGLSSDHISTVVEDATGTLWVGTEENGLNALRCKKGTASWQVVRTLTADNGMSSNVILSMAVGLNGDLWVGTPDGLNRIRGAQVNVFTSADGLPDDFVRSLLIDADGSLWVGTRHGLTHWPTAGRGAVASQHGPGLETYTHSGGMGSDLVGTMARDANGDLWVATLQGLSLLHGKAISNFTTVDGLSNNVVTALLPRGDGTLLIGTQGHGLNQWAGRKFSTVQHGGLEQTTIHTILDDRRGHFWFATEDGIVRCDSTPTDTVDQPGTNCSHWVEFGTADGLISREMGTNGHPSGWRSHDGLLWFATPKGLVEIDPAHFPVNTLPPPVALEGFRVDDVPQPLTEQDSFKVQAGHVHFEFNYVGLSLVLPQKVRYRYTLEGFDRGWTEAGPRRAAYYTNIPPGKYTFRVQAANNDGVWNATGAAFRFELRPHYYQAVWFYLLLLASAAGAVLLLLRQRVGRVERAFQVVLAERTRIAREIHDTLAQGYVGVSVQLEVLAELLRQGKKLDAAQQLDRTREYVRDGLADARQSIWALRTQDATENTLPIKLRRIVEAAAGDGLTARFSLFGAYRALAADMEQEMVRVAQEAIHNVKKHSGAGLLTVQLEYGEQTVTLQVQDDGRGGALQAPAAGHFGLMGMRERAGGIGGTLVVDSVVGAGTTIRLCVPARADRRGRPRVQS